LSLFRSIRNDIKAALDRDPAATSAASVILTYPGFHARQLHRFARTLRQAGVPLLPSLIAYFNRFLTGIEIHPGATIGEGLFIDHGMGVVIGETTIIGDNCHLTQGVTLGGTSTRHEKRHPTLENNVYVGVGAKIIGAVSVGEHATIGAGSVVVSSVPAYATVVGVPGKVIAYYDPGNDTKIRLPDPEWDRIEDLEQRLDALKGQVEALEAELAEHGRAAAASAHRRAPSSDN
jgi:serine O-acetyltransferase